MEAKNHGQTINVGPSSLLQKLCENHWRSLGFSHTKAVATFRFMVSKFMYDLEEEFTETDKVALFTAWEKMANLAATDENYRKKHGMWIFVTRTLVTSLNNQLSREDRVDYQKEMASLLSRGRGYFSAHAYFGIKIQGLRLYEVWVKTRFKKKFTQKKHVGVGYNDHGTAKDFATDGSPHWTEVAMSDSTGAQEESVHGKRMKLFEELACVHPNQAIGSKRGNSGNRKKARPKG
jgi:hypothetical protein